MTVHTSLRGRYIDEEVQSNYTYPKEYTGPKPIEEQVTVLAEIFNLDPTSALEYTKNLPGLPAGAEGRFAIVSDTGLKKLFPEIKDDIERHCAGVRLVHEKIAESSCFYNSRNGQITNEHLRLSARTAEMIKRLVDEQSGHDILVVAAQFGLRHCGRSVRRACECFDGNEFGLDSLSIGAMILTHPKRLLRFDDLWIDCAGDEFNDPVAGARFSYATSYCAVADKIRYNLTWCDYASSGRGSVTAFLPAQAGVPQP